MVVRYIDCIDAATNQYKINMVVYKGSYDFAAETEPWIQVLKSDGSLYSAFQLDIIYMYDNNLDTPTPYIPVYKCDSLYGVGLRDSFFYSKTITLDSFPIGGLTFIYQRCCSPLPLNFEAAGMTLFLKIYANDCNSTPRSFHHLFNRINCWRDYFDKNHASIESDGDSITYELIPTITGAEYPPFEIIPPMMPDPFVFVNFIPPYSLADYIGGLVPMVITPEGHLVGEASVYGSFFINILVKEYRDGILLSEMNNTFSLGNIPCLHPYIALLNDTLLCNNTSVELVNIVSTTATAFAPHNYLWDFGVAGSSTDTSSASTPIFTYPAPGSYTVTLIDGVVDECADTAIATVVVSAPVEVQFNSSIGCVGDTIALSGSTTTGSTISTWQWSGSGINSIAQSPSFVFAYQNPIVTLAAVSDLGCVDVYTDTLQLILPATTSATSDTTICFGATLTLQASGGGSYSWIPNAQMASSVASSITITPTLSDHCDVTITDANGCQTLHYEQVWVEVITTFHADIGSDTLVTQGIPINLTAPQGVAFEWLPTGETTQAINYTADEATQLILIATDMNGCKSYDTLTVRVNEASIIIPNAFSPDSDNINDVFMPFYNGIEQLFFLQIFNRWGEKIFETKDLNAYWDGTYNGTSQPLGTYFVHIQGQSFGGKTVLSSGNVTLVK